MHPKIRNQERSTKNISNHLGFKKDLKVEKTYTVIMCSKSLYTVSVKVLINHSLTYFSTGKFIIFINFPQFEIQM